MDIKSFYPNRTIVSSRTIYNLVQIRRAGSRFAAYRNRTHRNLTTNNFHLFENNSLDKNNDNINVYQNNTDDFKKLFSQYLNERLKAMIIISSVALIFMVIVVTICIIGRYFRNKHSISTKGIEQTTPLNPPKQTNRTKGFCQSDHDTRDFSRKPRKLPTDV
ncbi:unnamed protein product [Rotaria sordida]|uniref:Uncharacterized protein n=1 Tax=Rotaria sordida TaxID=392033 RepID=A0A818NMX8_9BILA|nr:unnamed protein product [Rotaria sordida]CAF3609386.1 unnamed protein product [Rotaria sordida]